MVRKTPVFTIYSSIWAQCPKCHTLFESNVVNTFFTDKPGPPPNILAPETGSEHAEKPPQPEA